MKLSPQDENRKPTSRGGGDPHGEELAEETTLLSIRGKRRGDERNESCEERLGATDSTPGVRQLVECPENATRKNTIERTTEEEKKRIERVSNATNPTSRTPPKGRKVQMDAEPDGDGKWPGDDQHHVVRNRKSTLA